jgi:hypothetical protein
MCYGSYPPTSIIMASNELFTKTLVLEKTWYIEAVKLNQSGKCRTYIRRISELLPSQDAENYIQIMIYYSGSGDISFFLA